METSLYIHIPFCKSKCLYCDFLSVPIDPALARRYALALKGEMDMAIKALGPRTLRTIYIGGGTPTVLEPGTLRKIFAYIKERFALEAKATEVTEVTMEANPGTVDGSLPALLAELGVNRLSLGVQSMDESELRTLGRSHSALDVEETVGHLAPLRDAIDLSLDLIYGIPGQTLKSWGESLGRVLEMRPSHVSAYELTPEPGTPLIEALQKGDLKLPEEDEVAGMFDLAHDTLTRGGFRHYEISNYALPGHECRHNLNYWQRGEYMGLGAGAHSFIGNVRSRNVMDVAAYIEDIESGRPATEEKTPLSAGDALREEVFLGLRTSEGLDIRRFSHKFGLDLMAPARELIEEGMMKAAGGRLRLTRRGMLLCNPVTVRMLEGLGL